MQSTTSLFAFYLFPFYTSDPSDTDQSCRLLAFTSDVFLLVCAPSQPPSASAMRAADMTTVVREDDIVDVGLFCFLQSTSHSS